jgi:deferrochelatase/peroxidase EfeB
MSDSNGPGRALDEPAGPSRRRFLAGLGTAGVVVAGGAGFGLAKATATSTSPDSSGSVVSFYGAHQAGIATPAQDRLAFASFTVTAADPMKLQILLGLWAAAAARMTAGEPIGTTETAPQSPPVDTGEALGLSPAGLTIGRLRPVLVRSAFRAGGQTAGRAR